jgi:hypothetical protein
MILYPFDEIANWRLLFSSVKSRGLLTVSLGSVLFKACSKIVNSGFLL